MGIPSGTRIGPPPLSRARFIAGIGLVALGAALAWYAAGTRQRADRLAAEVARLHEVERGLRDSLARLDSALGTRSATAPAPSRRP